jgi:queuine tRNA-ribosyltransferase
MRVNEMLGAILLSTINLAYYQELMAGARDAIEQGRYAAYCDGVREGWAKGDLPPL